MNKLAFLNKVVIKNDKQVASKSSNSKRPSEGADLRVYHTGAVYPSEELVAMFNLEYNKERTGNGLDVFEGAKYHGFESENNCIMIAAVSRKAGRGADIFKTCDYTEAGPKASVLDQGATTFGKSSLIPMLEKAYGVILDKDEKPFVDMKVVGCGEHFNEPFMNSNGSEVYFVPKQVAAGEAKGNWTTVRREKLLLWALVPMDYLEGLTEPIVLSGPVYREQLDVHEEPVAEEGMTDDMAAEAFTPPAEEVTQAEPDPEPVAEPEVLPEWVEPEPVTAGGIEATPEVEEEAPAPLPKPTLKAQMAAKKMAASN